MTSRTWFKIFSDKWLSGTIREEDPNVRSVWIDLLALAANGQYGDIGEIKVSNGVGLTDNQIIQILNIRKSLWNKSKKRLIESQRIEISPRGAIKIINWNKYQSEYNRQKPYRKPRNEELNE